LEAGAKDDEEVELFGAELVRKTPGTSEPAWAAMFPGEDVVEEGSAVEERDEIGAGNTEEAGAGEVVAEGVEGGRGHDEVADPVGENHTDIHASDLLIWE
jgi:hypothetical protein